MYLKYTFKKHQYDITWFHSQVFHLLFIYCLTLHYKYFINENAVESVLCTSFNEKKNNFHTLVCKTFHTWDEKKQHIDGFLNNKTFVTRNDY